MSPGYRNAMIWRLPFADTLYMHAKPSTTRQDRVRAVALAHDVLIGPDVHDLHGQGFERCFFVLREADDVSPACGSARQHGFGMLMPDKAPCDESGERTYLSAINA
jgi:hypothetical protein